MLLNKHDTYRDGDIVVFKVVNGDEIVAEIVEAHADAYVIKRPQTVVPSAKGMGLMPSLFTAKDDAHIVLSKSHIILSAPAVEEMERHYTTTVTGIIPITRGSIIT